MRAISLWQPWASLWCSPCKVHETRHWSTPFRGWLLVHAAKTLIRGVNKQLDDILTDEFGPHWGLELDTGALIGAVNIVACKRTEDVYGGNASGDIMSEDFSCGDFAAGRFAWQRSEFKKFARPIPFKGRQRFFNVPDDLVREALAA